MSLDLGNDLHVLAATIDGEAEGEPLTGKYAVAGTAITRAEIAANWKSNHGYNHPIFGDGTIRGACLAAQQYDCWNPDKDRDRIMALDPDNPTPAFKECLDAAQSAIGGAIPSPAGDATHYFAISIAGPRWLYGARWRGQFGSQLFWRAA